MTINSKILESLPASGVALILGGTGAGKSALGYSILETFQGQRQPCVYGFPIEKAPLLPDFIKLLTTVEFPEASVVLCDEAYISFYSRQAMSERNKFMDTLSGLARQKDILLIYITQSSRKLDVGLVAGAETLLIKRPSLLQIRLERGELRTILADAKVAFQRLQPPASMELKAFQQRCTYVLTDSFEGMVTMSNGLPSFWREELSKAWGGVSLSQRPDNVGPDPGQRPGPAPQLYPSDIRTMVLEIYRSLYRVSWELHDIEPGVSDAAQGIADQLKDPLAARDRWPEVVESLRALEIAAGENWKHLVSPILSAAEGLTSLLHLM